MKERTRKISQTMQLTKQKTECVGVLAFTSSHNQKEDKNQSKINNNQKCQKIKMHGTPTTKELKKKLTRTTKLVLKDKEIWPK